MLKFDQQLMRSDYATIRRSMPSCDWDRYATLVAAHHRLLDGGYCKPEFDRDLSLGDGTDFAKSGLLQLPFTMSPAWAASIRDHLTPLPVLTGHNYLTKDRELRPLADVRRIGSMAAYQLDQIISAPHLVDVLNYAR